MRGHRVINPFMLGCACFPRLSLVDHSILPARPSAPPADYEMYWWHHVGSTLHKTPFSNKRNWAGDFDPAYLGHFKFLSSLQCNFKSETIYGSNIILSLTCCQLEGGTIPSTDLATKIICLVHHCIHVGLFFQLLVCWNLDGGLLSIVSLLWTRPKPNIETRNVKQSQINTWEFYVVSQIGYVPEGIGFSIHTRANPMREL